MPTILMMTPDGTAESIALKIPETTIGRAEINDIVIDTARVSRFHAVLTTIGPFVTIKDLDSRNGVVVNGEKVETQTLMDGDNIDIGGTQLRFVASDQEFTAVEALRMMTVPGLLVNIERRPDSPPRKED